jgi:hypothetical protein
VSFAYFLTAPLERRSWLTSNALTSFIHHRIDRPSVTAPLSTARQLAFALAHILPPKQLKTPTVVAYMNGLGRHRGTNPLPQPAADPDRVTNLLRALATLAASKSARFPKLILTVALLMSAALRTPEAILTMQHGRLEVKPHPELPAQLALAAVTPWGLKDDKKRKIVNPRPRPMVFPAQWEDMLQAAWGTALSEAAAEKVDRVIRDLVHAAGIADVRMLRRLASAEAWSSRQEDPEQQALQTVRAVLGHRDNSQSTMRYIPSRTNAHTQRLLTAAATTGTARSLAAAMTKTK